MLKHIRFLYALLIIVILAGIATYYIVQKGQELFYNVDSSYSIQNSRLSQRDLQARLWKDFSYEGKPVSPKCLSDLIGISTTPKLSSISLAKCSVYDHDEVRRSGDLDDTVFKTNFPVGNNGAIGEVSYTPFAQTRERFFLVYTINTGGSTYLSSIVSVQKTDTELKSAETISPIGDRCNGGITAVAVLTGSNTFMYGKYLTPIDIMKGANKYSDLKPFKDLENSASSCFGQEFVRYNIKKKITYFDHVQLLNNTPVLDQSDWTNLYTHQSCFNKVFNSYSGGDKNNLTQDELTAFYKDFAAQCLE